MRYLFRFGTSLLTFLIGMALSALCSALSQPAHNQIAAEPHVCQTKEEIIQSLLQTGDAANPEAKDSDVATPDCFTPDMPKPRAVTYHGILNDSAIYLPQPRYPPQARAAEISGEVEVSIVIDIESGEVIWARIERGHPLLRAAVQKVVCKARFSPICLGPPVKANGVLIYKFQ